MSLYSNIRESHLGPPFLPAPMVRQRGYEEIVLEPVAPKRASGCCDTLRATPIIKESLEVLDDPKWMSCLVDLFGIASHTCSLLGDSAAHVIPYLGIFSASLDFYHAVKASKKRFLLMKMAYRTSQVAETIFWTIRSLGAIGNTLEDIVKPLAGGVTLIGLTVTPALGLTFQVVFPIILIVLSTLGGVGQCWDFLRSKNDLHHFHQEKSKLKNAHSLEKVERFLQYLQGPQPSEEMDRFKLKEKRFKKSHSTNSRRRQAIQSRIKTLLNPKQEALESFRKAFNQAAEILDQAQAISCVESSFLDRIEAGLTLTESFMQLPNLDRVVLENIEEGKEELIRLKEALCQEGLEIAEGVQSEMHRKLSEQTLAISCATITLIAGILFLAFPHHAKIGSALALSASIAGVLSVIYNKKVSQENFLRFERFLGLLSS